MVCVQSFNPSHPITDASFYLIALVAILQLAVLLSGVASHDYSAILAVISLGNNIAGCALGIDCDVETPIPNYWLTIYPCAVDNASRILNDPIVEYVANNTPYNCLEHCSSLGYLYAGVEYSDECYCGTGIDVTSIQGAPDDECNMPCSGDSTQTCGGSWRMQVYFNG